MYALEEDTAVEYGDGNYEKLSPLSQMEETAKREYWAVLALRHCGKLGVRTQVKLLQYFGSAYTAMENKTDWPAAGVKKEHIQELNKELWRKNAKKEWDAAAKSNAGILLWPNKYYPSRLRELVDAPPLLYCLGETRLLQGPAVAIVGSRSASERGMKIASSLAADLAKCGLTVISGMALGIDRWAHAAALTQVGKSIGILGTGINIAYPFSNKDLYCEMIKTGLLISEFSPDTPPVAANFPVRNRIISGLSLGIVVVEASERSGSLITARLALEQNREVFAVPGDAFSSCSIGCQNLVRQGAHAVFNVDDILRELSESLRPFKLVKLSQSEQDHQTKKKRGKKTARQNILITASAKKAVSNNCAIDEFVKKNIKGAIPQQIIVCLMENGAMTVDNLADALGLEANVIISNLTFMEMRGKVKRLPGSKFEAN